MRFTGWNIIKQSLKNVIYSKMCYRTAVNGKMLSFDLATPSDEQARLARKVNINMSNNNIRVIILLIYYFTTPIKNLIIIINYRLSAVASDNELI